MRSSDSGKVWRVTSLAALAAAVVAVLLSLSAVVIAWRATERASDAVELLAAPTSAAPDATVAPPPPPTTPQTAEQQPTDNVTGTPPTLTVNTEYAVKYTDQALQIPAGCNDYIYVDLDEPRVQAEQDFGELLYEDPCGTAPATLQLQPGVEASAVTTDSVTPVECAQRIRTSPLSVSEGQPVRRGQAYCITTSIDAARSAGITWKMVVLTVTATGQDGTVALKATAWDIPK